MTEGNGHVIDPDGAARRALQEAVAQHGPEALSNAVIMDSVCRDHLSDLPGESILIGSAARTNVPALLREPDPSAGQLRCDPVSRGQPGRGAQSGHPGVRVGGSRVRPGAGLYRAQAWDGRVRDSGERDSGERGRGRRSQLREQRASGGRAGRSLGRPASRGRPWGRSGGRRCWLARWAPPAAAGAGGCRGLATGGHAGEPVGRAAGPAARGIAGVQPQHAGDCGGHRAGRRLSGGRGGGAPEPVPGRHGGGDLVPVPEHGAGHRDEHSAERGRARARVRTGHRMRPPTRARRRTTRSC